ncbi:MAG: hypothetical protein MK193_06485 [Lentisphaeria bacterium]|nr:hypothetical protein [Lentisphaeria bacterium]
MIKIITLTLAILSVSTAIANELPKVEVSSNKQLIETHEKFAGNKVSFDDENLVLVVNGAKKSESYINTLSISDIKSVNVKTGSPTEFQITTK